MHFCQGKVSFFHVGKIVLFLSHKALIKTIGAGSLCYTATKKLFNTLLLSFYFVPKLSDNCQIEA